MSRSEPHELLLGEWACLGILYPARTHGFSVAARLKPTGDIGRVWSMSRSLTYRALDHLASAGYIEPVGEEPGIAGGNRTILAATRIGRLQLRKWLNTPVIHLRDLRSELLLKLILADNCGVDVSEMLARQRELVQQISATIDEQLQETLGADVVTLWRSESSHAALRFLDRLDDG